MTKESSQACVLCLGYFDGVHLGHQALLKEASRIGQERHLKVIVHTYSTSPAKVLFGKEPMQLTGMEEKISLLKQYGADEVALFPFDDHVRQMSGKAYFDQILLSCFECRWIVAGEDHRFGSGGDTGKAELESLCGQRGIGLSLIPPVCLQDGTRVSSSAIRKALEEGNIQLARVMLGHPINTEQEVTKHE